MRTANSLKNALSSLSLNLIIGLLGFIKVSVFVDGLSTDIYSLNQLFYQILGYIAIADVGFGLLLNKKLYSALAKNDRDEVNRIYSTSKKFYNYIGLFMLGISVIISFFIGVFTKADLSNAYMQIVFIIFSIRNLIDYFFIAPKYVLEADQKYYFINHWVKGIKILETIIEILLVILGVNYLVILIPGVFISIIMNVLINKKIYKEYEWLEDYKSFDKKYLNGTKDVIIQKLTGLVNSNTDVILLSSFVSSISVVIYTSYTYITKFLIDTLYLIATAITPSYANLLNVEDKEKSYEVFNELNTIFLYIASFITIMLYGLFNSFITIWIGKEYLVNKITLFLFCYIAFQKIAERAVIIVVNSKGLFKETKLPILFESILNVILSLLLVNKYGICGVLFATVISKAIGTCILEPIIIHKKVFGKSSFKFFVDYIFNVILIISSVFILNKINIHIDSMLTWIVFASITGITILILLTTLYTILSSNFRKVLNRGIELIRNKKDKLCKRCKYEN